MAWFRNFVWGLAAAQMILAGAAGAWTQSKSEDASANPARFEVASIRMIPADKVVPLTGSPISPPGAGQFTMREVTLPFATAWAFGVDQNRVTGGPDWLSSQYYEISAKPEGDLGLSYAQVRPLVQQLLEDRFHLSYHRETQNRKGYALVVSKGGPKLTASKNQPGYGYILRDGIRVQNRSIADLASMLQFPLGLPVVDESGLKGNFDFDLKYAPMDGTDSTLPSLSTALEEQLGLKLEKANVPVQMLVIDHVDRVPVEN